MVSKYIKLLMKASTVRIFEQASEKYPKGRIGSRSIGRGAESEMAYWTNTNDCADVPMLRMMGKLKKRWRRAGKE